MLGVAWGVHTKEGMTTIWLVTLKGKRTTLTQTYAGDDGLERGIAEWLSIGWVVIGLERVA